MTVMLVTDAQADEPAWVAVQRDGGFLYTYDPHLRRFVENRALWKDFAGYGDDDMSYAAISPARARELIQAGDIGNYDARTESGKVRLELMSSFPSISVDEAIPAEPELTDKQQGIRAVELLANSKDPDAEVIYRSYPKDKKVAAEGMASELRRGLRRQVAAVVGEVSARVVGVGDKYQVRVKKKGRPSAVKQRHASPARGSSSAKKAAGRGKQPPAKEAAAKTPTRRSTKPAA